MLIGIVRGGFCWFFATSAALDWCKKWSRLASLYRSGARLDRVELKFVFFTLGSLIISRLSDASLLTDSGGFPRPSHLGSF